MALWVFGAAAAGYLGAAWVESGNRPFTDNFGSNADDTVFATVTFSLVLFGLVLVSYRSRPRTGWLLMGFGLLLTGGLLSHGVAVRLLLVDSSDRWLGNVAAIASTLLITAALGLLAFAPAAWLSDGVEPNWPSHLTRYAVVALAVLITAQVIAPDSLDGVAAPARVDNPLGIRALGGAVDAATMTSVIVLLGFFTATVVLLAIRSLRTPRHRRAALIALGAIVGLTVLSVGAESRIGMSGWLLALVFISFAGIVALTVLRVRADRRRAVAERGRAQLVAEREDERRRLRADLHDGLGPLLAAIGLQLDTDDAKSLRQARSLVDDAIQEVRRIARNLRPATLDELGLVGALSRQANALSDQAGLTIDVLACPPELAGLPASVEVAAFRIAGEAMTNAARHSGARSCHVRLDATSRDGFLEVEVTDDGDGADNDRHVGLGMITMRDRAHELGGRFEIGKGPHGGVRVLAVLPVTA